MVNGGGIAGQAGAIKHGISRALELFDGNFRKKLKSQVFLLVTHGPRNAANTVLKKQESSAVEQAISLVEAPTLAGLLL